MIKLVNRTGKFMAQLKQNELDTLNEIGKFCVNKMQFYAAVDTGYMVSRCKFIINRNELFLQNDASYAIYQEMGTWKMPAHPFFRPAVFNHVSEIKAISERNMSKGMKE